MASKIFAIFLFVSFADNCLGKTRYNVPSQYKSSHPLVRSLALRRSLETNELLRPDPVHYGCFLGEKLQLLNSTTLDGNTNAACQKYCYENMHMFSATHLDTCGCLSNHPVKELSGPKHGAATENVADFVHECKAPCPGHVTDKCEKQFCCGGPGAYTVYQVGGIKAKDSKILKIMKDYKIDIEKTHLVPSLPQNDVNDEYKPGSKHKMSKAEYIAQQNKELAELKKTTTPEDYKALLDILQIEKETWHEFDACCSPECNWLLKYLEIDGTVVKCI